MAATASGSASSAASRASGVTQCAMPSSGSISGATKVGRRPESTSPSMIEEWTLRCDHDGPRWGGPVRASRRVGEGHADRVVSARGAVDQEPAALGAPGLGRETLRALEGGRLGPDVDPLDARRDVVEDGGLAEGGDQAGVGAGALVAGDVEAPRVARDVGDERVEVGGFGLVGHPGDRSRGLGAVRRLSAGVAASTGTTTPSGRPRSRCGRAWSPGRPRAPRGRAPGRARTA